MKAKTKEIKKNKTRVKKTEEEKEKETWRTRTRRKSKRKNKNKKKKTHYTHNDRSKASKPQKKKKKKKKRKKPVIRRSIQHAIFKNPSDTINSGFKPHQTLAHFSQKFRLHVKTRIHWSVVMFSKSLAGRAQSVCVCV